MIISCYILDRIRQLKYTKKVENTELSKFMIYNDLSYLGEPNGEILLQCRIECETFCTPCHRYEQSGVFHFPLFDHQISNRLQPEEEEGMNGMLA